MIKEIFKLGWKGYPKPKEINTEAGIITFIIKYLDEQKSIEKVDRLTNYLFSEGYIVEESDLGFDDVPIRQATRIGTENSNIYYINSFHNEIMIRSREKSIQLVRKYLKVNYNSDEVEIQAEVIHGKFTSKLNGYKMITYCGSRDQSDSIEFYPYKFIVLKKENSTIAKTLMTYYNDEMDEVTPTIKIIEIINDYQRKGIGKALVKHIESEAEEEGFDKIWASDMDTSEPFWVKLGYEVDLDEAFKYL